MESTMMDAFCRTANLRALFQEGGPVQLASMRPAFREAFDSNNRGTLYHDIRAFEADDAPFTRRGVKQVYIPILVRSTFNTPLTGFSIPRLSRDGVFFAVATTSKRDCNVMVHSGDGDIVPAVIQEIFAYDLPDGQQTYAIIIQSFHLSPDPTRAAHDLYRRWKLISGALYEETPTLRVVRVEAIVSHAIRRPYSVGGCDFIHFMPCDKVRLFVYIHEYFVYIETNMGPIHCRICFGKMSILIWIRGSDGRVLDEEVVSNSRSCFRVLGFFFSLSPILPFDGSRQCKSNLNTFVGFYLEPKTFSKR